jgi:predicted GNAT superfamily acetyltransferase
MSTNQLTIRTLSSIEDYHQAEVVQHEAWAMRDNLSVVPLHVLLTAQKNGGLVAGAFDPSGKMIGMLFGFVGLQKDGKFKHCSHIMGILPEVRRQNVGLALKLFQREYVQKQGFDLITWTFDPLEGVNASLNVGRLGVIARTFHHNLYGDGMADTLNLGLPTDRFEIEWWINSEHVRRYNEQTRQRPSRTELLAKGAQVVNSTSLDELGVPHILESNLDSASEILLVEIPAEFQAVKMVSMDLAQDWRLQTRRIFEHYFAGGYVVTDFVSDREDGYRRNFYVLANAANIEFLELGL